MPKAPCRVADVPADPKNRATSAEEAPMPLPGKVMRTSQTSGERMPRTSQYVREDVGHGKSPRIPWPQGSGGPYAARGGVSGVPQKPFRLGK